jgi:hypothetical protein
MKGLLVLLLPGLTLYCSSGTAPCSQREGRFESHSYRPPMRTVRIATAGVIMLATGATFVVATR